MIGTPFHERTAPLNVKGQWREWSGYFAASAYDAVHIHEYTAIRNSVALIDVSPLYKYLVRGRDAIALIDRVITRDATRIRRGQVIYTPWCDEHGKVIDDGTVARLDDDTFRWTTAEPHLRWFRLNSRGLEVDIEDASETIAAIALQGPLSRSVLEAATGAGFADLAYHNRRAARIGKLDIDVSRTGYTGDLGYELWVSAERALELWDQLVAVGGSFAIRPAGMLALDMTRMEAGLILAEVDYTSAEFALIPSQSYSPGEIGLGRLVNMGKAADFVGKRALSAEAARGGPARRLVGLTVDWPAVESLYLRQGLTVDVSINPWRDQIPIFAYGRQVGRATSGTWSPILKAHIALASVEPAFEPIGTPLELEWTVEGVRGRAAAKVVPLPFFDPPRKRS